MRFASLFLSLLLFSGCVYHDTATVNCDVSDLNLKLDTVVMASACNISNGEIHVTASGGQLPYQFFVNNEHVPSHVMDNLPPGVYSVSVRDAKGCEATLSNITLLADGFKFTMQLEEDTECLQGNGKVTVLISDGNKPYQYKIDGGVYQDDSTFTALQEGQHVVEVKDAADCTTRLTLEIAHGQTDVTWGADIKPIMTTYCATQGCHNGVARVNDLRLYKTAKFYSQEIKSRTRDKTMPFDGSLTQNQIDLISCWVADGALEN
jgi:hypothetical protein